MPLPQWVGAGTKGGGATVSGSLRHEQSVPTIVVTVHSKNTCGTLSRMAENYDAVRLEYVRVHVARTLNQKEIYLYLFIYI